MEIATQKKLAGHILRLLKVGYIDFPLGRTNKGNLTIRFDESNDFTMFLDSVPLPIKDSLQDENNIELKRMIEKYWFESKTALAFGGIEIIPDQAGKAKTLVTIAEKKHLEGARKGRPKGSKNKVKDGNTKAEKTGK